MIGVLICLLFTPLGTPLAFGQSSSGPAVSPRPSTAPSPALSPALSKDEASRLFAQFQAEQKAELLQVQNENSVALKQIDAAQKARYADWIAKERVARHRYFKEHPELKRAEKRAYILDYRNREKGFLMMEREERIEKQAELNARIESTQSDQAAHLKEFKLYIDKGERPPPWLR